MADKAAENKLPEGVKEIEVEGYTLTVDTDLLDDVETFEIVDRIENKGQTASIVPLLEHILGPEEYGKLKAYFTEKDAEAHKDRKDYKPRFRLGQLQKVYVAIIEKFDPKD